MRAPILVAVAAVLFPTSRVNAQADPLLRIRTAVVAEDLSVRPIPQVGLRLVGPEGDTIRTETDLDGVATVRVHAGEWRVLSAGDVEIGTARLRWNVPVTVTADGGKADLTTKNATSPDGGPVRVSLPIPGTGRRVSEEAQIFERVKSGVFTVWGEEGKGSGFLVDSAGVVLTNAHVVDGSREVRVQIDPTTKVRAKILHIDREADVAALLIPPSRCRSCAVLPLADPEQGAIAVIGERVLAIGSPLNQTGIMTIGIVSKLEARAIISDVLINHGNSGGPLINGAGEVIAINTFGDFPDQGGPGISGSILISQAMPALSAARQRLAEGTAAPADSLLPNAPDNPYPLDLLKAAAAKPKFDLRPFSGDVKGFDFVFLTPPSMAWRAAKAQSEILSRRKQREAKAGASADERVDPLQNWPGWDEYVGGRRAVIVLYIAPKVAETKASGWANVLGAFAAGLSNSYFVGRYDLEFKGDFRGATVKRDGEEIVPVDVNRSPAVLDVQTWTAKGKDYAYQGILVFRPEDFAPKADGTFATYSVRIEDLRQPTRPVEFDLSPKTVQAIWKDFAEYVAAHPSR